MDKEIQEIIMRLQVALQASSSIIEVLVEKYEDKDPIISKALINIRQIILSTQCVQKSNKSDVYDN